MSSYTESLPDEGQTPFYPEHYDSERGVCRPEEGAPAPFAWPFDDGSAYLFPEAP